MPYSLAELRPRILRLASSVSSGISVLLAHLLGNLEPPEGVDLPLRRSVPHRVRAKDDAIRSHKFHELTHDVRRHRREGHYRRSPRCSDPGVDVLEGRGEYSVFG